MYASPYFHSGLVLACLVSCSVLVASPFELQDNEVVAFLGGTNAVNLQNAGHLESLLTLRFASQRPRFIDLAWEGDTVHQQGTVAERWRKQKFGDLAQQLRVQHVSRVFVMFGQNEALEVNTHNLDDQLARFRTGFGELLRVCQGDSRNVVVVSPIPFETPGGLQRDLAPKNLPLAKFVAAMSKLSDDRGCRFVDLFHTVQQRETPLTRNGLHVVPSQQITVANAVASQLGLRLATDAKLDRLNQAVTAKHQLWMNYWRPANWKCLYGDDGEREFGKSTNGSLTLREEWMQLPKLIADAESNVWNIAGELARQEE